MSLSPVYPSFSDYAAAVPAVEPHRAWRERFEKSPGFLDQAFFAITEPECWVALPGGYFRVALMRLNACAGQPGLVRLYVSDADDGDYFLDKPASEENALRQTFQDILTLAPFCPSELGPVFGVWMGGQEPRSRPKRRR